MCAFDRPPPAPPQTYALGKGREADAWAKTVHSSAPHLPYERPEGNRQDGVLDGSVPLFWNKQRALEFLQALKVPGAENKLENFLLTVLSCNEMTAALRVNVLWKYIFCEPARWLTGKACELGWGLDDSSELLDAIYDMMQAVAADGRRLLDPAYDPFASFAAKYPEFAAWRAAHAKEELKAADGTSYPIHAMVLAEAREPTRAGNIQCEARVITLAEEMAEAALFAMRDPRRSISSMLVSQGGKFAVGADPGRNAATAGAHATNDRVESNFGCLDILMRICGGTRQLSRCRGWRSRCGCTTSTGRPTPYTTDASESTRRRRTRGATFTRASRSGSASRSSSSRDSRWRARATPAGRRSRRRRRRSSSAARSA